MQMSRLARIVLFATLVFSQALYAGHGFAHDAGASPDCQVCLQASGQAAAVAAGALAPFIPEVSSPACAPAVPAPYPALPTSHPARAPPITSN